MRGTFSLKGSKKVHGLPRKIEASQVLPQAVGVIGARF